MSGYGQYCPVAKASEILAERWMPLVARELLYGSTHFAQLQRALPQMSSALLAKRLRELEGADVIRRSGSPARPVYELTDAGRDLAPVIDALAVWGRKWLRSDYGADELDAEALMRDIQRGVSAPDLADQTVVIEFRFAQLPHSGSTFWLIVGDDRVELRTTNPGTDVDVWVDAELRSLTEVWMGDLSWRDALWDGTIRISGPRHLIRRFPMWVGQHRLLAPVAPTAPNGGGPASRPGAA